MRTPPSAELTKLLLAWGAGDEQALGHLLPVVYKELHKMARRYMAGERPDHTLQASALVNEAYLNLVDVADAVAKSPRTFWCMRPVNLNEDLVIAGPQKQQIWSPWTMR